MMRTKDTGRKGKKTRDADLRVLELGNLGGALGMQHAPRAKAPGPMHGSPGPRP